MRAPNLIFGIIAALSALAHGSGYTAPAYTLKANNQSLLLGYQLYGSHIYNASAVCKDVDVASHGIWDLSTWMVQRAFCDQLGATSTNRSVVTPLGWEDQMIKQNTRFFSTGLFITHLWYSFDLSRYPNATNTSIAFSPHPFTHLCAVLQPAYLEAFDLDSVRIRSAFCSAANIISPPPTPTATGVISQPVLADYSDIISTLFAYLLISSSRNSVEADEICVKAKERQADIQNSGLTAHTVYHVACGRDGRRMAEDESSVAMQLWTTKAYLAILENASDDSWWTTWLCDNLDVGSMNVTGLLGLGAKREVCGKGRLGNGECGYDWRTING